MEPPPPCRFYLDAIGVGAGLDGIARDRGQVRAVLDTADIGRRGRQVRSCQAVTYN
jgi:hypothetical protein